ncbi:virulence RhuM family protein [Methanorbis furvi]|uniref:Cell filamentation protein Fic n=1 Tax=Methanorbis furvi TaxID=3028299 RepID=A0AAE4MAL5_9EURY|nr:hypothetical protein [Methanocorpusculaceae archaeon Ag1]
MTKNLYLTSSTAEYLIFSLHNEADGIEVRYENGTLWLTQKAISQLFDVSKSTLSEHLTLIYQNGELLEDRTTRNFRVVQTEGDRQVTRDIIHYNLDAVISVGYRVNSVRATQFRRWATGVLKQYTIKGYIIDKKRMENGGLLGEDYFEELLEEIREIRISERRFYQKITDLYATAIDYDKDSTLTKQFFAKVQNAMHYAVTQKTAPEIIYTRASAEKPCMGLTSWKNSPDGKILKSDVIIAKNYLNTEELSDLSRIVSAFLDLAEARAKKRIPMTMQDWAERIDKFLLADDRNILKNSGTISAEIAKEHAESEYEKYRITQDKLYKSDFDLLMEQEEKYHR